MDFDEKDIDTEGEEPEDVMSFEDTSEGHLREIERANAMAGGDRHD